MEEARQHAEDMRNLLDALVKAQREAIKLEMEDKMNVWMRDYIQRMEGKTPVAD